MFLRATKRIKDGKEHRYWSIVESKRCQGSRVVQRQVLYLGEINDSQKTAWCKTIDVVMEDARSHQIAIFPQDRQAPPLDCDVVQVDLSRLQLKRPRQWGACWLACSLWEQLKLDIKEINSELIDRHLDNSVHRKFLSICSRDVTAGLLSVLSVPPLGIFEFLGTWFEPGPGSRTPKSRFAVMQPAFFCLQCPGLIKSLDVRREDLPGLARGAD